MKSSSTDPKFQRIAKTVSVDILKNKVVAIVGVAASLGMIIHLIRSGVGKICLIDRDQVEDANFCPQEFPADSVGKSKAQTAAEMLIAMFPSLDIVYCNADFLMMTDEFIDKHFGDVDCWVAATDAFLCQRRVNQVALWQGVCAVFVGLYANANAGEIIWHHPSELCCLTCLVAKRVAAQDAAAPGELDPASDGVTLSDVAIVDGIATQIVLALLTRGEDNRFGRLIDQLEGRQFIQISLRPDWRFGGRDLIRELLEVPADNDLLFAWNAVARRDPNPEPCPDCEQFRGHRFERDGDGWKRIWPEAIATAEPPTEESI